MSSVEHEPVRVAILDDYQHAALKSADWSALLSGPYPRVAAVDVFDDTLHSEAELAARLAPYPIVCSMRERTKFTASLLERLPKLRLLTTTGPYNRAIDARVARHRGVAVAGTNGDRSSTLEHIWALILGAARDVGREDARAKNGDERWQASVPMGLRGKTLGLVGLGHFGQMKAKIAQAFGMNVLSWSPNLTPERAASAGVSFAPSKSALLSSADIVSVHMVLAPSTTHLLSGNDFDDMKRGAILVNTSGGPIVDEQALVRALKEGKIRGAALDVFDVEPLPKDHELRKLDNVLLSPHLGYVSDDSYARFWRETGENITNFLDGKPVKELEVRS